MKEDSDEQISLEGIFEKLPGNVWWKDKNLRYLGCNDKVLNVLSLTRDQFIGKTDYELWGKDVADKLLEADLRVMERGETVSLEEVITQHDGTKLTMLTNKSPFYGKGGTIIGIVGTSTDITERKELEEKLREQFVKTAAANRSKLEFLEIISHEVKNPSASIVSVIDFIQEKFNQKTVEDIADLLSDVKEAAHSITVMLGNINEYVQFDKTRISVKKDVVNVESLIGVVIHDVLAKKTDEVSYHVEINAAVPKAVMIDVFDLHKVLTTIIGNAFKYTQRGSVAIAVNARASNDKSWLDITVKDTGVGLFPNQIQRIMANEVQSFDLYGKPSVKLPYAKLLVTDVMEGEFAIDSEARKGTTITVRIPFEEAKGKPLPTEPLFEEEVDFSESDVQDLKVHNILLVEDHAFTAQTVKSMLKDLKQHVDVAVTGEEAIRQVQQKTYDVILMDITLPDMNGIEVSQCVWGVNPNIPIAALTSHATPEDRERYYASRMIYLIPKPATLKRLMAFLKNFQEMYG